MISGKKFKITKEEKALLKRIKQNCIDKIESGGCSECQFFVKDISRCTLDFMPFSWFMYDEVENENDWI